MLALIAGTGDLPPALVAALPQRPLILGLSGNDPKVTPDFTFRVEHLGSVLKQLKDKGVTRVCMAGAITRPDIAPDAIDAATMPLVPQLQAALVHGDDGALRMVIAIFEAAGMQIVAAHEIAPGLLPEPGVQTKAKPDDMAKTDAKVGEAVLAEMGRSDSGQACVIRSSSVVAKEGPDGTDAMLMRLATDHDRPGRTGDKIGILFKGPKPNQDRRADLPLIGPGTVFAAVNAGLAGIVIEAGGVMVLNQDEVLRRLDDHGMFLWVRPRDGS